MAYSAINSSQIAAGEANKQELWQKVKNNFDDHESRILVIEGAASIRDPLEFQIQGPYYLDGAVEGVLFLRVGVTCTIDDVIIYSPAAGTSGTLEVDIQRKTGGGAFGTIFSTKPSTIFSAGSHAVSSNQVISSSALVAGDFLRLDIESVQQEHNEFSVYVVVS